MVNASGSFRGSTTMIPGEDIVGRRSRMHNLHRNPKKKLMRCHQCHERCERDPQYSTKWLEVQELQEDDRSALGSSRDM